MKWRARAYLLVGAARHVALAASAVWLSQALDDDTDLVVVRILPLSIWGVVLAFGALHLAYAALVGSGDHARTALVVSAGMTTAWAVGSGFSAINATSTAWSGALFVISILLMALALKDLIQCADPLRAPFDPVIRRVISGHER